MAMDAARDDDLALVMSGGGARAAYQVGVLRCLARHHPELVPPILTGVSAGAINAIYLAARGAGFAAAVDDLVRMWSGLETGDVFDAQTANLSANVLRWGLRLIGGGSRRVPRTRGLVDTAPLRRLLRRALDAEADHIPGVFANLRAGRLKGVAVTASSYTTGQSMTWIQGRGIEPTWQRAHRVAVTTRLTTEHVMASSALPLFFPAIEVDSRWYGDGGIRLTAPLSPAVHLGARRILAISVRHAKTAEEAAAPTTDGYPPPAQVIGSLLNAIFLDLFDADALRLQRINEMVDGAAGETVAGQRRIELLLMRPSRDLGQLANDYEPQMPGALRYMLRGLGTAETRSNDLLSLIMFQPDYLGRLIALGDADAEARLPELARFLAGEPA